MKLSLIEQREVVRYVRLSNEEKRELVAMGLLTDEDVWRPVALVALHSKHDTKLRPSLLKEPEEVFGLTDDREE